MTVRLSRPIAWFPKYWAGIFCLGIFMILQGCGEIDPGLGNSAGELSFEEFMGEIQPLLDNRGCAQSQCHYRDKMDPNSGGPGGGFRIFDCEESPCLIDELEANFDSSVGMANTSTPSTSKLLTKPLGESVGGKQHLGGDIFLETGDPDYQTLLGWIQSPL